MLSVFLQAASHIYRADGYGISYQVSLLLCTGFERLIDSYSSFNGCSMKTPEQLEVIKAIRPERLLLETGNAPCHLRTQLHAKPNF
jgi:Tat protein secretion system quality control protein TatD with DNase activity